MDSEWRTGRGWPEAVAVRAAGFVAGHRAMRDRFEAEMGLPLAEPGRGPISRSHLLAVLDFVIAREAVLRAFAARADLPLEAAYEARRAVERGGPAAGI